MAMNRQSHDNNKGLADQITKHKNVVAEKNEDHSSKALPKSVKERYSEGGLSKRERKRLAK